VDRTEEFFPQMAQMRIKGLTQRRKGAKNSEKKGTRGNRELVMAGENIVSSLFPPVLFMFV
jgi:hypothetical protein